MKGFGLLLRRPCILTPCCRTVICSTWWFPRGGFGGGGSEVLKGWRLLCVVFFCFRGAAHGWSASRGAVHGWRFRGAAMRWRAPRCCQGAALRWWCHGWTASGEPWVVAFEVHAWVEASEVAWVVASEVLLSGVASTVLPDSARAFVAARMGPGFRHRRVCDHALHRRVCTRLSATRGFGSGVSVRSRRGSGSRGGAIPTTLPDIPDPCVV